MDKLKLCDENFGKYGSVLPKTFSTVTYTSQEFSPAKNEFYRTDARTVILKPKDSAILYLKSNTDSEIIAFEMTESVAVNPNIWFYVANENSGINLLFNKNTSKNPFNKKTFSLYDNSSNFSHSSATVENMEKTVLAAEKIVKEKLFDIDLNVNYIAKQLNVSTSYLYRCSVRKYGIGMSQYICEKKLLIAEKLLLENKLSSTEIANRLNFCSQSYFSLQFKKKFGVAPLAYRKMHTVQ